MATYPKNSTILMLYANFVIYVRQQPRAARTQLQQLAECNPGIVERYRLFTASVSCVMKMNKEQNKTSNSGAVSLISAFHHSLGCDCGLWAFSHDGCNHSAAISCAGSAHAVSDAIDNLCAAAAGAVESKPHGCRSRIR